MYGVKFCRASEEANTNKKPAICSEDFWKSVGYLVYTPRIENNLGCNVDLYYIITQKLTSHVPHSILNQIIV